jgi:hypothetical protein
MGRNLYDHLDYAVLPYLYDGLWRNDSVPTIMQRMFPTTPLSLHPGTIVGRERLISKAAGTFPAPTDARGGAFEAYLYNYSVPVGSGPSSRGTGPTVTIGPLAKGQIVVVVPAAP